MRLRQKHEESSDGNIFWMTMTDLMTGLVLVFMVLFFYAFMQDNVNKIYEDISKEKVSNSIEEALENVNIEAIIDPYSGIVKISDLELFDLSSYTLSEKGKNYLDKFAPAYFNSIFKDRYLSENIDKIIIQGHTDTQSFAGSYSPDEQYMKNMELSLNRAYAVANYMTSTAYNKENGEKLRKMIIVEGASSSTPVFVNGKEDYNRSRRVELKIIMKSKEKKL